MKARIWVADRGDLRVTMLGHTVSRLDQRPQSVQEKLRPSVCPSDFSHFGFSEVGCSGLRMGCCDLWIESPVQASCSYNLLSEWTLYLNLEDGQTSLRCSMAHMATCYISGRWWWGGRGSDGLVVVEVF